MVISDHNGHGKFHLVTFIFLLKYEEETNSTNIRKIHSDFKRHVTF